MNEILANASFCIIGVGPGDPDLLTLKAVRLINMADVVVYPVISTGHSRARKTVSEHVDERHQELPFHLPMEVDPAAAQIAYDDVTEKIRQHLEAGATVALLCEGDPFFYGSAIHIYMRLVDDYTTQIVPGVSSLMAGATAAGLPLAVRSDVLKVLPATLDTARLEAELAVCEGAAIIKVGRHFDRVARIIQDNGLGANAIVVSAASQDDQHVVAFNEAVARQNEDARPYFSMILISRYGRAAQ